MKDKKQDTLEELEAERARLQALQTPLAAIEDEIIAVKKRMAEERRAEQMKVFSPLVKELAEMDYSILSAVSYVLALDARAQDIKARAYTAGAKYDDLPLGVLSRCDLLRAALRPYMDQMTFKASSGNKPEVKRAVDQAIEAGRKQAERQS